MFKFPFPSQCSKLRRKSLGQIEAEMYEATTMVKLLLLHTCQNLESRNDLLTFNIKNFHSLFISIVNMYILSLKIVKLLFISAKNSLARLGKDGGSELISPGSGFELISPGSGSELI